MSAPIMRILKISMINAQIILFSGVVECRPPALYSMSYFRRALKESLSLLKTIGNGIKRTCESQEMEKKKSKVLLMSPEGRTVTEIKMKWFHVKVL